MRKYLLSSIFLLLLGGLCAQQQTHLTPVKIANSLKDITKEASATSMNIGYCGDLSMAYQLGDDEPIICAIGFPAETMKKYVGNQVTKIKLGIGNDTKMKNTKVFLSHDLNGEPFYIQDVTFTPSQWNEITLTTPYQIEEKDLYIGFSLTSGTNANATIFGVDNEQGSQYNFLAINDKNNKLTWGQLKTDFGIGSNLCIRGVVEGNSLPQYEYALDYFMPEKATLEQDEKTALKGKLRNFGAQAIKSFDIIYQVGNATPVTLPITELNLNSLDKHSFTFGEVTANPGSVSSIKVTLSNINGLGASQGTDTLYSNVICPDENSVPRKVLLEHFTTAQCPNCPQGHTALEKAVGDNKNIIWVAHHAGYYADNYTIPESRDYEWFYNEDGAVYAPAMMIDRSDLRKNGAQSRVESPIFGITEATAQKTLKVRLATPAYVTVDMEQTFDATTRELKVTVHGKAIYGNLPGLARVNIYLTEDGLIGPQSGASNSYKHNHVIRKALTSTWGDFISFDAEGNYTVTYNCTLDSSWKTENMKIISFLGNYDSENPINCGIHNANVLDFNTSSNIGCANTQTSISIYSSESKIAIEGEYTSATVYDMAGKIVEILGPKQTSSKMISGVYIVKITNNEQTIVKRIAVQ